MGAHLGVGGKVVGDCAQCPMHLWAFKNDGTCADVPYTTKSIPEQAKAKAHKVHEWYGRVFVWFHADDAEPTYNLPALPELSTGRAPRYCGGFATEVNMHIMEFAENSADFAHFGPLHGGMVLPWFGGKIPLVDVHHVPGWKPGVGSNDADGQHIAWFSNHATLKFNGKLVKGSDADAMITFAGPASAVFFTFETPLGGITLFHCHAPGRDPDAEGAVSFASRRNFGEFRPPRGRFPRRPHATQSVEAENTLRVVLRPQDAVFAGLVRDPGGNPIPSPGRRGRTSRGDAAAATRMCRRSKSRRCRGRDADIPSRRARAPQVRRRQLDRAVAGGRLRVEQQALPRQGVPRARRRAVAQTAEVVEAVLLRRQQGRRVSRVARRLVIVAAPFC